MHSKCNNIKLMTNDQADEIIEELFIFSNRYQNSLKLIRDIKFVFHYAHLFYYKSYRININCCGTYR